MTKRLRDTVEESDAYDESETTNETQRIKKWIGFCYGAPFFNVTHVLSSHFKLTEAMMEEHITYCIGNGCVHPDDSIQEAYLSLPFFVRPQELACFLHLIFHDCTHLQVNPSAQINYHTIVKLLNFFGAKIELNAVLLEKLQQHPITKFSHSISILSYFELIQDKKEVKHNIKDTLLPNSMDIMYTTEIPLVSRLEFLQFIHQSDSLFYSQLFSQNKVSELLGVEQNIVKYLVPDECIIAGGASMYLACPWTKFTNRCDVDIFILNTAQKEQHFQQIIDTLLATKRRIYQNQGVITAIGTFGQRRIQLIMSHYKTGIDLVNSFDFSSLKCFYDGYTLKGTIDAQLDWLKKECSLHTLYPIKAIRLFGQYWKGFTLNEQAKTFLSHSIVCWPPKESIVNQYEHEIPYLSSENIPIEVQDANLFAQHKYLPYTTTTNIEPLVFGEGHYAQATNIWFGDNLVDYVQEYCTINTKYKILHEQLACWFIHCPFDLELNNVALECSEEKFKNPTCWIHHLKEDMLHKLTKMVAETLFQKWNVVGKTLYYSKYVHAKMNKHTKIYENGIKVLALPDSISGCRLLMKPDYFYCHVMKTKNLPIDEQLTETSANKLSWKITSIYYST